MVLGWLTAAVGWITALIQWRKKRRSETELKLVRRRGKAPFLAGSDRVFERLFIGMSDNEANFAGSASVLCASRDEVPKELPSGSVVRFVVENLGKPACTISLTLDGQSIQLRKEPDLKFANGLSYLEYTYDPKKHGLVQDLKVAFETDSGVQDQHTYRLKHGIRSLVRYDPL